MGVGYYSDRLMYANLYVVSKLDRRYGEGVMAVIVKELHRYGVDISENLKRGDGWNHYTWIVPALFYLRSLIFDSPSLEGDKNL